jgi:hypothetical protein
VGCKRLDRAVGSVNSGRWNLGWTWGRLIEMVGAWVEGFGVGPELEVGGCHLWMVEFVETYGNSKGLDRAEEVGFGVFQGWADGG